MYCEKEVWGLRDHALWTTCLGLGKSFSGGVGFKLKPKGLGGVSQATEVGLDK